MGVSASIGSRRRAGSSFRVVSFLSLSFSLAFTPIPSLLQQMLAGSLPTYTDQLLSKISTGLVQLTRTSDRASFYLRVLRPGTYYSLNLTFFTIRTVFACFAM